MKPVEISAVQRDNLAHKKKECVSVIFCSVVSPAHRPLPALLAEVIVLKGKASESETDHLTSTGSQAPQLASTVSAV